MKVHLDSAKCSGHAQCNVHGPDVFDLDDMGFARPYDGEVPAELHDQAFAAAEACPERAITVEQ